MAERGGFEPPIDLRLCLISSQVHSTGLCHLSVLWAVRIISAEHGLRLVDSVLGQFSAESFTVRKERWRSVFRMNRNCVCHS